MIITVVRWLMSDTINLNHNVVRIIFFYIILYLSSKIIIYNPVVMKFVILSIARKILIWFLELRPIMIPNIERLEIRDQ